MSTIDRRTLRLMLDPHAVAIAAARISVDPDMIAGIVSAYREACEECLEPAWQMVGHIHGEGIAVATYGAEGTQVLLQVQTNGRDASERFVRSFQFKSAAFETFAEAASFERRWFIAVERSDEATLGALCSVLDAHTE